MSASINDKITDVRNAARPNSARVTSGRTSGNSALACDNLSGWPTASKVHFVTYQIDSNAKVIAGTQLDCSGIVTGNNIGSLVVIDGTDTGNNIGDVVEMLPTAAWAQDLATAITHQHDRLGNHVGISNTGGLTTDTLTSTGNAVLGGTVTVPAASIAGASLVANSVTPAQMLGIDLFGVATTSVGVAPAAGSGQFYMQSGSTVGAFSSGALSVSFPTAFPTGVLSIIVCNGDDAGGGSMSVSQANTSTSGFRAQKTGDGTFRVNWIAIGF